ncbi:CYFA0S26e00166g1_1 [Cyberlindnera fabianii]|uniref:Large ribosomal subunit protein bL27m n=1 Tax=Cyberlindnera fabianii TaxID=36022 RepID=A0A061BBS1_CYBFA|nr:hypothetical protein BON22_4384 [Cyberlindnera fabianii]CDR46793.1 CYFA0S26e00166g1_1 [Cyberlindnera fabianii]
MSFVGTSRLVSVTRGISALTLNRAAQRLPLAINNVTGSNTLLQVRTATKKVAGSRTNMRDSAGRRLGAKVAENEPVKTGQILMRQRGTKFYPGENAAIGKDHTIYAKEPGYVRFYLDPFHPNRKFIGVALRPDLRLPTAHFEPSIRRLGYVPITDAKKAQFEENNLSRKAHLMRPEIIKSLKQREAKRQELLSTYSSQITSIVADLTESDSQLAAARLLSIRNHIKAGLPLNQAQATTTSVYLHDLKLDSKKGLMTTEDADASKNAYISLSNKIDSAVSFDNQYNLIAFTTEADRRAKVTELEQQLGALVQSREGKKTKKQIVELLFGNVYITDAEKKRMISKYLKPVQPEPIGLVDPKQKKASVLKRWNYEKKRVETLGRSKEAFTF